MRWERNRRWLVPSVLGLGIAGAVSAFFTLGVSLPTVPTPPVASGRAPAVTLAPPDLRDRERRELTDLEPLFLPTRHNTSLLELPAQVRREPGSMAFTFPPKLTVSESGGGLPVPEPIALPPSPLHALAIGEPPNPWPELGRADVVLPAFPQRLAYVEVRVVGTGETVLVESLERSAEAELPTTDWAPIEYSIAVDPAGVVGAPLVTRRTTSEEIENYFRTVLLRRLQLGSRLAPGFYTVHVGP
jgi:hypothetical protein